MSICESDYPTLGAGPFSTVWGAGITPRSPPIIWVVRRGEVTPIWSSSNEHDGEPPLGAGVCTDLTVVRLWAKSKDRGERGSGSRRGGQVSQMCGSNKTQGSLVQGPLGPPGGTEAQ